MHSLMLVVVRDIPSPIEPPRRCSSATADTPRLRAGVPSGKEEEKEMTMVAVTLLSGADMDARTGTKRSYTAKIMKMRMRRVIQRRRETKNGQTTTPGISASMEQLVR